MSVQDIVFNTEITPDGPWHSFTVYFHSGNTSAAEHADDAIEP